MMKRFFVVVLFISAVCVYGIDFTHFSYLPSLYNRAVGTNAVWNRFKERECDWSSSIPISETKLVIARMGAIALNISVGLTLYNEEYADDSSASSDNISLGIGVGALGAEDSASIKGFFVHAYPLYEFPLITEGDPVVPWKFALDAGYMAETEKFNEFCSLCMTLYSRMIGAFMDTGGGTTFYLNWPDFGIALGARIVW
jgi:hypothetical protein